MSGGTDVGVFGLERASARVADKPRLLDLFCGAGGCAKGYQAAGFYVIGIDNRPQPNYCGDEFHQADALEVVRYMVSGYGALGSSRATWSVADFDGIHASPPCQAKSPLRNLHRGRDYPELIASVREFLAASRLPYVIENVEGARNDLVNPVLICGSMFDPIAIDRHRLFETNWNMQPPDWPCRHSLAEPSFPVYEHGETKLRRWPAVYGHGGGKSNLAGPEAMGIDWMTRAELVEAIPPRFTEFIGQQLLDYLRTADFCPPPQNAPTNFFGSLYEGKT